MATISFRVVCVNGKHPNTPFTIHTRLFNCLLVQRKYHNMQLDTPPPTPSLYKKKNNNNNNIRLPKNFLWPVTWKRNLPPSTCMDLPEQLFGLHLLDCEFAPRQLFLGKGLVHVLILVCDPLPQLPVQGPQGCHRDHLPWTMPVAEYH